MPIVDISKYTVLPFDYSYNQDDDFHILIEKITDFDVIILASPVYWYSLSAQLKCFIDRWTDLLTINKSVGRLFRGKSLALIASYHTYPDGTNGFLQPIKNTANYMGMNYLTEYLHYSGDNIEGIKHENISFDNFVTQLQDFLA